MLTVVVGCMFAGKTERLISLAHANEVAGNSVLAFTPENDNRYANDFISTHSGLKYPARTIQQDMYNLIGMADLLEHDVFIFDEAQFLDTSDAIWWVEKLLRHGKDVVVGGLSQDSSGNPFGAMPHFLAIADDIVHLKAVCAVTRKIGTATRTFRKDASNKSQVAVGGSEMYEPRSFDEWLKAQLK